MLTVAYLKNAVETAQAIMLEKVKKGNVVIDATVGNGKDTLLLCNLIGDSGHLYGFDIQDTALEGTKAKLKDSDMIDRVTLIYDGHEHINHYVHEEVDLVIYNLGYLPKGNHDIITKPDTTIMSINKACETLKKGGLILIVSYTGHPGGELEKNTLESHLKSLDQSKYTVMKSSFINQINNPPLLFCVEKKE